MGRTVAVRDLLSRAQWARSGSSCAQTLDLHALISHIAAQTNYDVGYVMASVIPVFFVRPAARSSEPLHPSDGCSSLQGISQCLIVVRIALTNEFGSGSQHGLSSHLSDGSRTIAFSSPRYSMAPRAKVGDVYADEHLLEVLPNGPRVHMGV